MFACFIAVKMSSQQKSSKDKPRSLKCRHFCFPFDNHNFCPSCREGNKGDDPCVTLEESCEICSHMPNINLFAYPPRPQPLHFESLSLKTPAKSVPPTLGMALQQNIESKPWVLSSTSYCNREWFFLQASMLEVMKSL